MTKKGDLFVFEDGTYIMTKKGVLWVFADGTSTTISIEYDERNPISVIDEETGEPLNDEWTLEEMIRILNDPDSL